MTNFTIALGICTVITVVPVTVGSDYRYFKPACSYYSLACCGQIWKILNTLKWEDEIDAWKGKEFLPQQRLCKL